MNIQELTTQLSLQEITDLQENLKTLVSSRIIKFFQAIQNNDLVEIESFIKWGIPRGNAEFYETWNALTIKPTIKLETLNSLSDLLEKDYKKTQDVLINKVVNMLSLTFDNSKTNKNNIFTTKDYHLTDLLQWLQNKHSNVFHTHFKDSVHNNWGTILFDPIRHQSLEHYYLETVSRPQKSIIKASRIFNKEMMEHFNSPPYLKNFDTFDENLKIAFFNECVEKSIQASNIDSLQYWLDKGIALPHSTKPYIHLIQQSFSQENFLNVLELIIETAKTPLFNDQVFLKHAIESNRLDTVKHLLNKYYTNKEYIEEVPKAILIKNKSSNESTTYVKEFYKYWSLAVKLEEKDDKTDRKMKI